LLNILLSSIGRRSYLAEYFREALGGRGKVIGTNCLPDAPGLHAVDVPIVVPAAREPDYVPGMLDICRQYNVGLLFSLHDLEAPYLSGHKAEFEEIGTRLAIAEPDFINVCLDKYETMRFAGECGIKTPVTFLRTDNAQEAVAAERMQLPLIVKPRCGCGSIGLYAVHEAEDLTVRVDLCKKDISRAAIPGIGGSGDSNGVMIQEMVQGQEYGLDVVNDLDGNFAACFVKRKLGMRAGETDAAETEHNPQLEELGRAIGCASRHPGVMDVDVMVCGQTPYLIEMNPRFGGHYPFAHMAGANAPAALIAWANGNAPNPEWLKVAPNVRSFKDISLIKVSS
jgi:carbamoyl-phosphate synthase large subunit